MIPQERVNIIRVNVDTIADLIRNKLDEAFMTVLRDEQTVRKLSDIATAKFASVLSDAIAKVDKEDIPTFRKQIEQAYMHAVSSIIADPQVQDLVKSKLQSTYMTTLKSLLLDIWPSLQDQLMEFVSNATSFVQNEVEEKVREGVVKGLESANISGLVSESVKREISSALSSIDLLLLLREKLKVLTSDAIAEILQEQGISVLKPSDVFSLLASSFSSYMFIPQARNAFAERLAEKMKSPIKVEAFLRAPYTFDCNNDKKAEPVIVESDHKVVRLGDLADLTNARLKCKNGKITDLVSDGFRVFRTYGGIAIEANACLVRRGSACIPLSVGGGIVKYTIPDKVKRLVRGLLVMTVGPECDIWNRNGQAYVSVLGRRVPFVPMQLSVSLIELEDLPNEVEVEVNWSRAGRRGCKAVAYIMLA